MRTFGRGFKPRRAPASSSGGRRWTSETGELPVGQYDDLLSDRTRLLAVTAASNVLGTRPDVAAIACKAHGSGALTYVDGVHWTPHGPVDVVALGADFYATSAYKWSGPHIGAVDRRTGPCSRPSILTSSAFQRRGDRRDSSGDTGVRGPRRRCGGCGASLVAGLVGDGFEARTEPHLDGGRREVRSCPVPVALGRATGDVQRHVVRDGRPPGADGVLQRRRPRSARSPSTSPVAESMSGTATTTPGSSPGRFGIRESGGAVRAGLVHYNDGSDVGRLLEAVAEL